jgi:membrane protein DedA with SNARE-associated domain
MVFNLDRKCGLAMRANNMKTARSSSRWRWVLILCAGYLVLCALSHGLRNGQSDPLPPSYVPESPNSAGIGYLSNLGDYYLWSESDACWQLRLRLSRGSADHDKVIQALFCDGIDAPVTDWVGQGLGAAIVLEYAHHYPDSVSSVTLLGPRGIEPFDLMGNHLIDRPLRRLEASFYAFLDRGLPFSWVWNIPFDSWAWNRAYRANGSLDETHFQRYGSLLAGKVSVEQTKRLESRWFSMLLVEPGDTTTRYEELIESLVPCEDGIHCTQWTGIVLIALSTLISEDLACIGSGILVSQEIINWITALLGCLTGIFFGDLLIYLAGRLFGERLVRKRPLKWFITEDALERSERWFEHSGIWVLLASRFMPGTRVPVYFAAGVLKARFWLVSAVLLGAALLWVPVLVLVAFYVGEKVVHAFERYETLAIWLLLGTIALIFFLSHQLLPLVTYRGRRVFYSRIQRLIRWEFWPAKVLYLPVACYALYLSMKHRSLTLCTLANPIVPMGGLLDESKSDILRKLEKAKAPVSDFLVIQGNCSADAARAGIATAQRDWGVPFPIVLKPDVGERGKGVHIVKNDTQLEHAVEALLGGPFIVQKFVGGIEYGVLYERMPHEATGKITSITSKRYTAVVGDGVHDLEHLILSDPRAVFYSDSFLKTYADRLFEIPAAGEKIPLVEIGTHARGSLFLDACNLNSPALERRFNEFCPQIEGYYLGRFDVKVPDEPSLCRGENVSIIELNLLTSEPTHMYDPAYSVWYAWRVLFRHWRKAYEIGAALRRTGKRPPGTFEVLRVLAKHYLT